MKTLRRILLWSVLLFFLSSFFSVLYYKWRPVQVTPLMLLRYVEQVCDGRRPKLEHRWVPLDSISPYMPVAVIASEDQNFLKHHGFDVNAIADAVAEQKSTGRRRGASTITQQTAKNVFLWPHSDWLRKGLEAYFSILLEAFWSKERIMEVYLNSIEMGEGIYGVAAVAQENFNCTPLELRRSDCALIAATLPNPRKYDSAHPNSYMRSRQRWIQQQMKHVPLLTRSGKKKDSS